MPDKFKLNNEIKDLLFENSGLYSILSCDSKIHRRIFCNIKSLEDLKTCIINANANSKLKKEHSEELCENLKNFVGKLTPLLDQLEKLLIAEKNLSKVKKRLGSTNMSAACAAASIVHGKTKAEIAQDSAEHFAWVATTITDLPEELTRSVFECLRATSHMGHGHLRPLRPPNL